MMISVWKTSARWKTAAALLLSLWLLSGCSHLVLGPGIPGTSTKVVKVLLKNGNPRVDNNTITVIPGDRVIFVGPDTYSIDFPEGTPFNMAKFSATNAVINVRVSQNAKPRKYKYNVRVGDKVLDPHVIVSLP